MTSAIGFRIGGGVLLSKKIVFALDYYGLGAHNITGKARSDGIPSEDIDSDLFEEIQQTLAEASIAEIDE